MLRFKATYFASYSGITLLWFAAIYDPIGNLYLRYIALGLAFLIIGFSIASRETKIKYKSLRNVAIVYISILTPIYGLVLASLYGGLTENFIDTSYIGAAIILLTSLIYRQKNQVDFGIKSFIFILRSMIACIILVFFYGYLANDYSPVSFFTKNNIALFGFRTYGRVTLPYIFFLASPMLIYLVVYDLHNLSNKFNMINITLVALSLAGLIFSGTRAHMLLGVSMPLIYFYYYTRPRNKMIVGAVLTILVISFLSFTESGAEILTDMLSLSEASNAIKIGFLGNYANIFNNIVNFLFGQGYNAHTWSQDLVAMIGYVEGGSKTELTYIELIRVYGLLGAVPYFLILYWVYTKLKSVGGKYSWIRFAYLMFMINAALNPFLFSVNGMLPLGLILALIELNDGRNRVSAPQ